MRTTLNLPDALVKEAKLLALEEQSTLTALVIRGLKSQVAYSNTPQELPISKASGGLHPAFSWDKLKDEEYYR